MLFLGFNILIWTSLFWPSSSRCRHLFAKGPYPLINGNAETIKFYTRYVDDTLILTKPENIPSILDSFN
jgi:hypothetical protein